MENIRIVLMEKNKRIAPLFSVIIPAYNAENCIKYSITASKLESDNYES